MDVSETFEYPMISILDTRNNYGEDRISSIGYVQNRVKSTLKIILAL
ncbi:MAG: hypothetical protein ACC707_19255 [Thiohalomonadales bacterium]